MKPTTRYNIWFVVVAMVAFAVLSGCEKSADQLQLDNPFDPAAATGGDAMQIRAVVSGNSVILTWTQPQGYDIEFYNLLRGESAGGSYEEFARIEHTNGADMATYSYNFPSPPSANWFKVKATTIFGDFSFLSLAVPAEADIGPVVILGDTLTSVASRFTPLTITAAFGDSLLIGFDNVLLNPLRIASAGAGLPTPVNFDFGPADTDSTFQLKVLAFDALSASPTTTLALAVTFGPRHSLVDANRLRLIRRVNDLSIPSSGVVQMRFADSEDNLATAAWVPGADVFPAYQLEDSANSQEIWAEYEGDFGFNTTTSITVLPDLLSTASFLLKIPSNRVVSVLTVPVEFSAGATALRISENPNFAAVPWQAYADTMTFQLSVGEGTKTIYTQFRNDWTQSDILTDYCIYISQGPDVNIVVPSDGAVIIGGSTVVVRGTSNQGTVATGIDTVQVDFGDGLGFRQVTGVEDWQLDWNVPTFTADTEVVMRARAVADSLVVTDFITVTVSQMTIEILDPLADALVVSGTDVNISGLAGSILGGDPIDNVVIDIGAEQIIASGTNQWTATWTAVDVLVDTPITVVVTAWAGTEFVATTVDIVVQPAP